MRRGGGRTKTDTTTPKNRPWLRRLYQSPVGLVFIIGSSIFLAELLVMVILYFFPGIPELLAFLIDASMLLLILAPVLGFFVLRPLREQIVQRKKAEEELRNHQDNLERTIEERTARLTEAVRDLEREIAVRKEAETALQASEERFRQFFQQSEDAIFLFKPGSCSIIDINPVAERMYGFTRQELFEEGPPCFLKSEEAARFCAIVTSVRPGVPFHIDRAVHVRKDGTEATVSVRGKTLLIQNVELVYCTFSDITNRVRLEEEARLIQAKLIHTNKMESLGVLMASIAHEINNPNNFIMSNAQFLSRAWGDAIKVLNHYYEENGDFLVGGLSFAEIKESGLRPATEIVDGCRRISEIISNLKDFARQDSASMLTDVDCNRVATLAASIVSSQIRKYTDYFRLDLAQDLPLVRGSLQQLEQVVINLIINALQALPDKSRAVTVATRFDPAGNVVELSVGDQGTGIPPEVASRMMEPFFTTKLDRGGTGLGLSISHSIVKEHLGELTFRSEPGKETVFTVVLPAVTGAVPGRKDVEV